MQNEKSMVMPKFTQKLVNKKKQVQIGDDVVRLPEERRMAYGEYLHESLSERNNPRAILNLQKNLLHDIIHTERTISELKKDKRVRKTDDGTITLHRAETFALRDIADGMAWRLFGYNRGVLFELANKSGNKHINIDGTTAEWIELEEIFKTEGNIAILNDLTHCLMFGDITVKKSSGEFEIIEVKSGNKKGRRIKRQKQGLESVIEFLNMGEGNRSGEKVIVSQLNIQPETYTDVVSGIIQRTEKEGAIVEQIDDSLILTCVDFTKADDTAKQKMKSQGDMLIGKWEAKEEFVSECLIPRDRFNDRLILKIHAPFSVYPFPEVLRLKILMGDLWIGAYVNVDVVLRYLQKAGWKLVNVDEHEGKWNIQKGSLNLDIFLYWFNRLGYEFVKPQTLLNALEDLLSKRTEQEAKGLLNFSGEPAIWD